MINKITKYEAEPFCKIHFTTIEAIDNLPREQQYPTLRAIIVKRCGLPIEEKDLSFSVNRALYRISVGYKGVEIEE